MPNFKNYTDTLMDELPSGGTLTCVAFFGLDGLLWHQSEDFPEFDDREIQAIIAGLDEPYTLAATGINLAGYRFMLLPSEAGDALRGRSKDRKQNLIVKKTYEGMIIGISQSPVSASEAEIRVTDLGSLLIQVQI